MSWNPFKCRHPAAYLGVDRKETRKRIDDDFDAVDYHLFCRGCLERVDIKYAALRDGVKAFMEKKDD